MRQNIVTLVIMIVNSKRGAEAVLSECQLDTLL